MEVEGAMTRKMALERKSGWMWSWSECGCEKERDLGKTFKSGLSNLWILDERSGLPYSM